MTRFELISDQGTGRSFVFLIEKNNDFNIVKSLSHVIGSKTRAIVLKCEEIDEFKIEIFLSDLLNTLADLKIRQASFVSFGACGTLIQALALREPKLIRTMVIINGSTRPHPSSFAKLIDRIEHFLPLGLPLRLHEVGFDSKPFLQRIRCPVLVVTTQNASQHELSEAQVLSMGFPTAWQLSMNDADTQGFVELISNFQDVPAKCPQ